MMPDTAELLHHHRRQIEVLRGVLTEIDAGLWSGEAAALPRRRAGIETRITELEALVAKHDPDGFTVLR